jgi:hypothetical protein
VREDEDIAGRTGGYVEEAANARGPEVVKKR